MLRAAIVIDYQNVHLTARDIFCPGQDAHHALIHPMNFARAAVNERNARQKPDMPHAQVERVTVYRGLPHADYAPEQNGRCQEQARQWTTDGAIVELRDLKYRFQLGADHQPIKNIHGKKIAQGPGREKGIDVLCALACVREARDPNIDLVILASRDTDLVPALDEVYDMRGRENGIAKMETVSWFDRNAVYNAGSLRPTAPRRIWNTNLNRRIFNASLDRNTY